MKIGLSWNGSRYTVDLSSPEDISIPLNPDGKNPNCFFAPAPTKDPVVAGDFIGSTAKGGPLNFFNLHLNPHGNGTHTECAGHITDSGQTINETLHEFHIPAELISVHPVLKENGDRLIEQLTLEKAAGCYTPAIVIRTLPNTQDKKHRNYSGSNPPYMDPGAVKWLVDKGYRHLLIDLPSVDREEDGGRLLAHKSWWGVPGEPKNNRTITELVFVPDKIDDGLYLLNLQITSLEMDASPSKPLLYPMIADK